jgi:hypothetical protein
MKHDHDKEVHSTSKGILYCIYVEGLKKTTSHWVTVRGQILNWFPSECESAMLPMS